MPQVAEVLTAVVRIGAIGRENAIAEQITLYYKATMQVANPSTPQWVVFTVAVSAGLSMFALGFRLTDEVIVVAIPLLAVAFFGGAVVSARGWLWGVGMGLGILLSKLYPPPPYVPDARHLALYGPPQPLPLPFGLVASPVAQHVAGALIFVGVPTIVAALGWSLKRVVVWAERL